MTSYSSAKGLHVDREKQIGQMVYIYKSKPRFPIKKSSGRCWTECETTGKISAILNTAYHPILIKTIRKECTKNENGVLE